MFRRKNANTKVENVESTYGIDLNARGDSKLGNLLRRRGFDSQSQLIRAARGQSTEPARGGKPGGKPGDRKTWGQTGSTPVFCKDRY